MPASGPPYTPTYSSWLNPVEGWFVELTTKWIKRSAHRSVRDLVASIRIWIANWNDEPKPYVWHESADEILDSLAAYCQRINDSGHWKPMWPSSRQPVKIRGQRKPARTG